MKYLSLFFLMTMVIVGCSDGVKIENDARIEQNNGVESDNSTREALENYGSSTEMIFYSDTTLGRGLMVSAPDSNMQGLIINMEGHLHTGILVPYNPDISYDTLVGEEVSFGFTGFGESELAVAENIKKVNNQPIAPYVKLPINFGLLTHKTGIIKNVDAASYWEIESGEAGAQRDIDVFKLTIQLQDAQGNDLGSPFSCWLQKDVYRRPMANDSTEVFMDFSFNAITAVDKNGKDEKCLLAFNFNYCHFHNANNVYLSCL